MPVQRVSKPFKDISSTFQINPLNRDLIGLTNENAIARSIRNLILTRPGERPFNPILGSNVSGLLFESLDQITASNIKSEISTTIDNFEPRIKLDEVIVKPNLDNNAFDVSIRYTVVGVSASIQVLSFALELTR